MTKAERAYALTCWCAEMKWLIDQHGLWLERRQILDAIYAKARELGNPDAGRDSDDDAMLWIWDTLKPIQDSSVGIR